MQDRLAATLTALAVGSSYRARRRETMRLTSFSTMHILSAEAVMVGLCPPSGGRGETLFKEGGLSTTVYRRGDHSLLIPLTVADRFSTGIPDHRYSGTLRRERLTSTRPTLTLSPQRDSEGFLSRRS
jgi:hypothetical protein